MPSQLQRLKALLPNGEPRYVRCYDNGGETADRYTVVFTGRYRHRVDDPDYVRHYGPFTPWYQHISMSADPFHPQGIGMHGESQFPIDLGKWGFPPSMGQKNHLGKRILFHALPEDCRKLVMDDYLDLWNLRELVKKFDPKKI